jgi:hypothetical protein
MMAARQTLLNLVAQKYTNRREDVAVDALGYILGYSDAAREAITDKLRDANIGVAAISKVITQATGVDGERPDLACYDDQDNECLLIEAKFWARLTDNQPGGYLNRLHGDPPSTLLFVAPAARLGSLWSDLQQRLSDQGLELDEPRRNVDWMSAEIRHRNQYLMVISWANLLDGMAQRAENAGDTAAGIDIDQLRGLAAQEDDDAAFMPLRPEELNPEIPRRILSWKKVVARVINEMTERDWTKADNRRAAHDDTIESYGRMLDFAGTRAWFGISHEHWARRRNTPLWLELYDSEALPDHDTSRRRLNQLEERFPGEGMDEDWYVPIFVPTGLEHAAVQDHIVQRLEIICQLIDPQGPTYK